jgi:hypothetical protein
MAAILAPMRTSLSFADILCPLQGGMDSPSRNMDAPPCNQNFITALPTMSPVLIRSSFLLISSNVKTCDAVTNLVLGCKRHDLTQIRVVAPKRAMKGLFAGYAREYRYIDSVVLQL